MLEELMNSTGGMQEEMQAKLESIEVQSVTEGIKIIGVGTGVIKDISVPDELCKLDEKEKLEDLLILAINNYNGKVAEAANEVSADMMKNLFSGGLGNLFG